MLSINTNLSSLIAQNSLSTSTNKLNQAIERMSTGLKINHAKDNAANYSISTNMTTKIGAYNVAEDNVAMGLDMLTTASESLSQIETALNRLRTLAVQASNGTYGTQSKQAINAEANALVDEIERLQNTTEYNGINLAKGRISGTENSKFIKDIDRRDTSRMTKFEEVNENEALTSGTYSISTDLELAKLATMTDAGLIGANTEFVLADNIDLQAWCDAHSATGGWNPIGTSDWTEETSFKGTFDGNGYVISNIVINRPSDKLQGLFAKVSWGCVKNLGIEGADLIVSSYSGSLMGSAYTSAIIENVYCDGEVNDDGNGAQYLGGIFGEATRNTVIDSVHSNTSVICTGSYIGGISGNITRGALLTNSFSTATLKLSGSSGRVGGLAGFVTDSEIKNCFSECLIESDCYWLGGIAGAISNSAIENCYSNSEIIGNSASAGGIVGAFYSGFSKLVNCLVLKDSSSLNGIFASGLPTYTTSTCEIINCSYNSAITSTNKVIGNSDSIASSRYSETGTSTCDATKPFEITNDATIFLRDKNLALQVGVQGNESSQVGLEVGYDLHGVLSLRGIGNNANYLSQIDTFLNQVSAKQTDLGSAQNRLLSALDEITIQRENLVSSRSTILDADMAEVSSTYIQQQILQQASATLMSTANQAPAIALRLLQGF